MTQKSGLEFGYRGALASYSQGRVSRADVEAAGEEAGLDVDDVGLDIAVRSSDNSWGIADEILINQGLQSGRDGAR